MLVTFQRQKLIDALTPAMGCVSAKNTIASIEGFLLKAHGDSVTICSYDMEKGYITNVKADIVEEGEYILDADKFYRFVRSMSEDDLVLEIDPKKMVKIKSGSSEMSMTAMVGSDFPSMPEVTSLKSQYEISQAVLKTMLSQVSHAIAVNENRIEMNGANFVIENSTLTVMSCDGIRLAIRRRDENVVGQSEETSFIVPGKSLSELIKLLSDDVPVGIYLATKHIVFIGQNGTFFSRLIDSKFINTEKVIPTEFISVVKVCREFLISALERASLISDDSVATKGKNSAKLEFEGNMVKVSATSSTSSAYEEVPIELEGQSITMSFNCRFLLDALKAADGDKIAIRIKNSSSGIIITNAVPEKNSYYLYMVCPVRTRD